MLKEFICQLCSRLEFNLGSKFPIAWGEENLQLLHISLFLQGPIKYPYRVHTGSHKIPIKVFSTL